MPEPSDFDASKRARFLVTCIYSVLIPVLAGCG